MVEHGATTMWELWQEKTGDAMNSRNHPMFGSIGAWFYEALAGINFDEKQPGYKSIRIQPQVVGDLNWASGNVEYDSWTGYFVVVAVGRYAADGSEHPGG